MQNLITKNPNPIILEDTHPAIISKEYFKLAQSKKKRIDKSSNIDSIRLKRMLVCECGRVMCYDSGKRSNSYRCPKCNNHIRGSLIHEVLYKDVINVLKEYEKNPSEFQKKLFKKLDQSYKTLEYNQLKKEKENLDNSISKLFEDKLERIKKLKKQNQEIENKLLKYEQLLLERKLLEHKFKEFKESLVNFDASNKLELIRIMISSIIIYKDNRIKNKYKFQF